MPTTIAVCRLLDLTQVEKLQTLTDILHAPDPLGLARFLIDPKAEPIPLNKATLLAPIDQQEVWAAGVTYKRSQVARMEESKSGASHYDKVYTADRPELFFKATPGRVSGPGEPVRVRFDSRWSVPEPELALVVSDKQRLVGFTIGNDMSARDIEGENPLYLPQAKLYRQSCALGPCILIPEAPLDRVKTRDHGGRQAKGERGLSRLDRSRPDGPHVRGPDRLAVPRERFSGGGDPAHRHRHRSARRFRVGRRRRRHDGSHRHRHADEPGREKEVMPGRVTNHPKTGDERPA